MSVVSVCRRSFLAVYSTHATIQRSGIPLSQQIPIVRHARLQLLTQLTSVNFAMSYGKLRQQQDFCGVITKMSLYRRANAHRSPKKVTDGIESPHCVPRHL